MSNKEILLEILKSTLESRLKKLEENEKESEETLIHLDKEYKDLNIHIDRIILLREETEKREKAEREKKEKAEQEKREKQERLEREKKEKAEKEKQKKLASKDDTQKASNKVGQRKRLAPSDSQLSLVNKANSRLKLETKKSGFARNSKSALKSRNTNNNALVDKKDPHKKTTNNNDNKKTLKRSKTVVNMDRTKTIKPKTNTGKGNEKNKEVITNEELPKKFQEDSLLQNIINNVSLKDDIGGGTLKKSASEKNIRLNTLIGISKVQKPNNVFENILSYLKIKDKLSVLSSSKEMIKKLKLYIGDLKEKFFTENNLPNNYDLNNKIKELRLEYTEEDFSKEIMPFSINPLTEESISIINSKQFCRIFRFGQFTNVPRYSEIEVVYKLYTKLAQREDLFKIEKSKDFWKQFTDWIKNSGCEKITDFFFNNLKDKVYTEEQIYSILVFIKNKPESFLPKEFTNICSTTGLVCFIIKDVLEYIGLLKSSKTQPKRLLTNYEFFIRNNTMINKRVDDYIKKLGNM